MKPSVDVLGRKVASPDTYAPEVLVAIPRALGRASLGLSAGPLPFFGQDIWNAYELAWRDLRGVPQVAVASLRVPATSPNIVESKSLKLYLGSLHRRRFADAAAVVAVIEADLRRCIGAELEVSLTRPSDFAGTFAELDGDCVDDLVLPDAWEAVATEGVTGGSPTPGGAAMDVDTEPSAELLVAETKPSLSAPASAGRGTDAAANGPQRLTSRLLRSLCPVTAQPDWADVQLLLVGARVQPASFLRYVVAFAGHTGFHEQCVERMFIDVQRRLGPSYCSVYARYTRRGGIDINPYRCSEPGPAPVNTRTFRQ